MSLKFREATCCPACHYFLLPHPHFSMFNYVTHLEPICISKSWALVQSIYGILRELVQSQLCRLLAQLFLLQYQQLSIKLGKADEKERSRLQQEGKDGSEQLMLLSKPAELPLLSQPQFSSVEAATTKVGLIPKQERISQQAPSFPVGAAGR